MCASLFCRRGKRINTTPIKQEKKKKMMVMMMPLLAQALVRKEEKEKGRKEEKQDSWISIESGESLKWKLISEGFF